MPVPRVQSILKWLAVSAVVCFALQLFSDNKADVDLWGNIGFVQHLPGSDGFLTTNTYSYTEADRPWVNHEWLAEYLLYQAWHVGGNAGLLLLKVVMGVAVLGLMASSFQRECRSGPVQLLMMMLMISTMGYGFSTRPHLFTYLMLAVFLFLLKRFRYRAWLHLLVFPLLGILWANLHGAFFAGALILLTHAVTQSGPKADGRRTRALLSLYGGVVLFVLASFINPFGVRLWGFIFESGATARTYLSEWQPFSPIRHGLTHLDFICLAVVVCCAYPFTRTSKDASWTTLLYLSLLAAIVLRRNIPVFAIVAGFTAGKHVDSLAGGAVDRLAQRVPRLAWSALLLLFIPFSAYTAVTFEKQRPLQIEIAPDDYPLRTVAFMKEHALSGNIFVFFDWAEYCIWHLYPDCRVFMDGRFRSAYSETVVNDYLAGLYGGESWERVLTAYPTDMALLHFGNPLAGLLAGRADWQLIHSDGPAMLYVRASVHGDVIGKVRRGELRNIEMPEPVFP